MGDPQLALLLCRLLFGSAASAAELRLVQQLQQKAESCGSSDAAAAAAACCWLQADAAAAVAMLLGAEQSRLAPAAAAATAEQAAHLRPLLRLMLTAVPAVGQQQQADWRQRLQQCLWGLAAALQACGLHALAGEAVAEAELASSGSGSSGQARPQHEVLLQQQLLAVALLPAVLELHQRGQGHADAEAASQLELLQQRGVPLDAPAILSRLRRLRRGLLAAGQQQRPGAWAPPATGTARASLERQQSSGGSSYRSRDSEQTRLQQQQQQQQQRQSLGSSAVLGEGCVAACLQLCCAWQSSCVCSCLPLRCQQLCTLLYCRRCISRPAFSVFQS